MRFHNPFSASARDSDFVPAIVIGVVFSLFMQAVVLRGKSGWNALTYSSTLLRGNAWEMFLLGIVIGVPVIAIPAIIQGIVGTDGFIPRALAGYASGLVSSFSTVNLTVVFLQLDVQSIAAESDAAGISEADAEGS